MTTRTLLHIDRLFFPVQLILELVSVRTWQPTPADGVIAIKLKGKGSIIRFIQLCEQMDADKNKLTLITFAHQRDVCEWLQIKNVLYIRTANPFHFISDCWKIYRQTRKAKPRVIVNLERCSHAVNAFGLFLSWRRKNKLIFFEPFKRVVSDRIVIYSADALSIKELFKICIDELPRTNHKKNLQNVEVFKNKIVVNINASDLLAARRYSIEGFAYTIRALHQYDPGLQFVLVGADSEHSYVEQLIQLLKDVPAKNSAGQFSFKELTDEFARAALVLTSDSMALHLAAYLEVPVVALWGPTQPGHFGYLRANNIHSVSLNLPCAPCFIHPASKPAKYCKGRIDCLSQLKAHQVAEACKEVLRNNLSEREVNFPGEINVTLKPKFAFE